MKMLSDENRAITQRPRDTVSFDETKHETGIDGTQLTVNPLQVARVLVALVAVILVAGTVANVVIYHVAPSPEHGLAKVMQRFDLGHEPSLPAWYSSLALVGCAGLLGIIALVKQRCTQPFVFHWSALAVLFVLMGLDEAVMIHEMVDTVLHNRFNSSGILHFAWVIPGAFLVLTVGIAYLKFLGHLDSRTRWLFVFSGFIFVAGAIGMELVAGVIFTIGDGAESLAHTASQTIEEGLEMLGVVLFIYALLDYIGRDIGRIVIRADAECVASSSQSVIQV